MRFSALLLLAFAEDVADPAENRLGPDGIAGIIQVNAIGCVFRRHGRDGDKARASIAGDGWQQRVVVVDRLIVDARAIGFASFNRRHGRDGHSWSRGFQRREQSEIVGPV